MREFRCSTPRLNRLKSWQQPSCLRASWIGTCSSDSQLQNLITCAPKRNRHPKVPISWVASSATLEPSTATYQPAAQPQQHQAQQHEAPAPQSGNRCRWRGNWLQSVVEGTVNGLVVWQNCDQLASHCLRAVAAGALAIIAGSDRLGRLRNDAGHL